MVSLDLKQHWTDFLTRHVWEVNQTWLDVLCSTLTRHWRCAFFFFLFFFFFFFFFSFLFSTKGWGVHRKGVCLGLKLTHIYNADWEKHGSISAAASPVVFSWENTPFFPPSSSPSVVLLSLLTGSWLCRINAAEIIALKTEEENKSKKCCCKTATTATPPPPPPHPPLGTRGGVVVVAVFVAVVIGGGGGVCWGGGVLLLIVCVWFVVYGGGGGECSLFFS